jgi:hypothetical protein
LPLAPIEEPEGGESSVSQAFPVYPFTGWREIVRAVLVPALTVCEVGVIVPVKSPKFEPAGPTLRVSVVLCTLLPLVAVRVNG